MFKKLKTLSIIITVLIFVVLAGCNKTNPAGAPYDATPTPLPELSAEITLTDNSIPASGVLIQLLSNNNITTSGTTNANGYVGLALYGYGNHRIVIPNDVAHGFTTPLDYSLDATTDQTIKTIDRGTQLISVALDPLNIDAFGAGVNNIKYDIFYKTDTQKKYTLSVKGLPATVTWQFVPPYVLNDGDTSMLTITTPKYWRLGKFYSYLTFTAFGDDGDGLGATFPAGDTISGYALYQNWAFDLSGVSVTDTVRITNIIDQASAYTSYSYFGKQFQGQNLSNFPTQYPLQISIVPGSLTYYYLGITYTTANSYIQTNPQFISNILTYTSITTTVQNLNATINFTNIYGGLIQGFLGIGIYGVSANTMQYQLNFSNSDGFNYILNCGTNY
jgi:hypothetical protein